MLDKIIIDADFCLKLGGSEKYRFLFEVLPFIADKSTCIGTPLKRCVIRQVQQNSYQTLFQSARSEL